MKKYFVISLLFIGATGTQAQDAKKVFSATEIVWFGMDFSKATFVGGFDQGAGAAPITGAELRSKYIPGWNTLIQNEQPHFDFKKSFRKDNVYYDIASVNEVNSKIDADKCMSPNPGKIEKSEVAEMVKKYSSSVKKEGIGLAFVVENFNKATQLAEIYVTLFDISSKKVLVCEKMSGKGVGIGIRNYWAGAIKNILKQIDENEYKNWQSKY